MSINNPYFAYWILLKKKATETASFASFLAIYDLPQI